MSHTGDSPITAGIDIGTTSVKAVAVDAAGHIVSRGRVPHPVIFPAPDRMEHDADRAWRRGPRRALRLLRGVPLTAVAVSTMTPSLTAVDRRGRPLTPGLLYGDARGRDDDRASGASTGSSTGASTGSDSGEALGFLRWTAAAAPDAHGYWPAPAVVNYALGRVPALDIGSAFSAVPLFGAHGWDEEVCASVGVGVEKLPRIEMIGAPIGKVTGSDIVLAGGCVDGMTEQLVAGADTVGDVHVICGTTLINWIKTSGPVNADGLYSVQHPLGGWVVGGPSNAGGLFIGAVARLVGGADGSGRRDGARPAGRASNPGGAPNPDDIPVWSPYIRGERTPINDHTRRGRLVNVTLTQTPASVMRAAWEASAFVVRHHIDLAAQPVTRIVATGGGTRVEGWMQALADGTGLPVHAAAEPEGAALGAAFLARQALGLEKDMAAAARWARTGRIFEPDPVWQAAATARYPVFRAMADAVP